MNQNDYKVYVNNKFGKNQENKNIRIDSGKDEVKIKKVNIFGEKWRKAYGFSNI